MTNLCASGVICQELSSKGEFSSIIGKFKGLSMAKWTWERSAEDFVRETELAPSISLEIDLTSRSNSKYCPDILSDPFEVSVLKFERSKQWEKRKKKATTNAQITTLDQ